MPKEKEGRRPVRARIHEYAPLAGMSDDAVRAGTGLTWEDWVEALDAISATALSHRETAKHVQREYGVSTWWAQTVTVGYERIRGLREIGQRRGGAFEANKSKTFPVPVDRLYRAFVQKRTRRRWLPDDVTIRTSKREKSIRMAWADGTPVDVDVTRKTDTKSQVAIQHRKLPSKAAATKMKEYWAERLAALAEVLGGSREARR
ncbi:MAG: hypothetical protein PVI01_18570 [Gemmatimonadales bacterium]|jgi:uncharacterized protein YndB with AHSA1/START domain